jgi:serine/threonine protein kinase
MAQVCLPAFLHVAYSVTMRLSIGTRLGPYEILAPLGAGGMGEVYRARDTRLGRDVAVKVLPQHLTANPEVRTRFEREARTISSLNHPHICTLHDVGREGDVEYLVMELVEGETLAQRLEKGPLAMSEILRLGVQIADALDRAHRAGIVHRDFKPGNVMLTKSGAKLMDFGLARATGMAGPAGSSGVTIAALTQSPTVASPLTAEGTLVGTFLYMAPEQLEGKEADARDHCRHRAPSRAERGVCRLDRRGHDRAGGDRVRNWALVGEARG